MSDFDCPACGKGPLGSPYTFAGAWYAACRACHTETLVMPTVEAGQARTEYRVAEAAPAQRDTTLYRRRTPF